MLLEPEILAHARHLCVWYLPHQLEPESWILSLAFCCMFFALYPAINLVPPATCGVVYSSHTWEGVVVESLLSLVLVLQGEMEICDFKGTDPLLTVQMMRSHFDFLVLSCHFSCEWPPEKELCVTLQQCWLISLIQKSESREKLKTGGSFMSQVCSRCFNHPL